MKVIHYGSKKFDKNKFEPIKNDNWQKPKGGLWTSPSDSIYGWKEWNEDEQFRECTNNNSFEIDLPDNFKILKIDSKIDLLKLRSYAYNYTKYLDFEYISKHYDAIWLTEKGERETRHSGMTEDIPRMYGWDCETVLILNNLERGNQI